MIWIFSCRRICSLFYLPCINNFFFSSDLRKATKILSYNKRHKKKKKAIKKNITDLFFFISARIFLLLSMYSVGETKSKILYQRILFKKNFHATYCGKIPFNILTFFIFVPCKFFFILRDCVSCWKKD